MGRVVEGKARHTVSQCHAVNKKQRVAETVKKYHDTIRNFPLSVAFKSFIKETLNLNVRIYRYLVQALEINNPGVKDSK